MVKPHKIKYHGYTLTYNGERWVVWDGDYFLFQSPYRYEVYSFVDEQIKLIPKKKFSEKVLSLFL